MLGQPTDYFDFASSLIAFAESLPTSHLAVLDNKVFFRKGKSQLTLITYACPGEELARLLNCLIPSLSNKVKCLNFANKDMSGFTRVRYKDEFYVDSSWTSEVAIKNHTSKAANKIRNALKKGNNSYIVEESSNQGEVASLFNAWAEEAKKRHFMVVKGHYLRYIQRFYEFRDNITLLGFRSKETKQLLGVAGYEVFKGQAQITLAKHLEINQYFPKFFWITLLEHILRRGVSKVFCGSTADDLKKYLNMTAIRSYKLIMPKPNKV